MVLCSFFHTFPPSILSFPLPPFTIFFLQFPFFFTPFFSFSLPLFSFFPLLSLFPPFLLPSKIFPKTFQGWATHPRRPPLVTPLDTEQFTWHGHRHGLGGGTVGEMWLYWHISTKCALAAQHSDAYGRSGIRSCLIPSFVAFY